MYIFAPLDLFQGDDMNAVVRNVLYIKNMIDRGQLKLSDETPAPAPAAATASAISPSGSVAFAPSVSSPALRTRSSQVSASAIAAPGSPRTARSPSPTLSSSLRAPSTPTSTTAATGSRTPSPSPTRRAPSGGAAAPGTPVTASPRPSLPSSASFSGTPLGSPLPSSRSQIFSSSLCCSSISGSGAPRHATAEVTTLEQDLKMKEELKYSTETEDAVKEWICAVLKDNTLFAGNVTFLGALQSGVTLCQLMNALKPGAVPRILRTPGAFGSIQNILEFLKVCERIGLQKSLLFSPSDLVDAKNANRVLDTLYHLAQHAVSRELTRVPIRDTSSAKTLFSQTLSEIKESPGPMLTEAETSQEPCAPEHKELLAWANDHLARSAAEMGTPPTVLYNFSSDVRSGVKLLRLAEAVLKDQWCGVRYDPPSNTSECMQNSCFVFSLIEQHTPEPIVCCQPQDVVRGKVPRVVALVEFMRSNLDHDFMFNSMVGPNCGFVNEMITAGTLDMMMANETGECVVDEESAQEFINRKREEAENTRKIMEEFRRFTLCPATVAHAPAPVVVDDEEDEEDEDEDDDDDDDEDDDDEDALQVDASAVEGDDEEDEEEEEEKEKEKKEEPKKVEEEPKKEEEEEEKKPVEKPVQVKIPVIAPSSPKDVAATSCSAPTTPTTSDSEDTPSAAEAEGEAATSRSAKKHHSRRSKSGHRHHHTHGTRESSSDKSAKKKSHKKRPLSCEPLQATDSTEAAEASAAGGADDDEAGSSASHKRHHTKRHHHRSTTPEGKKDKNTESPASGLLVRPPSSEANTTATTATAATTTASTPQVKKTTTAMQLPGPVLPSPSSRTATATSTPATGTTPRTGGDAGHGRKLSRTFTMSAMQMQKVEQAQMQMRRRVANEILTTEESYVKGLDTMCDRIVRPLLEQARAWNGTGGLAQAPLTEDEVMGIFSSVFLLRDDHRAFLERLRARFADWSDNETVVGDLFVDVLPVLEQHYAPYLETYASASAAYHYIYAHNAATKALVDEFERAQYAINKLNVPSFLVMPVQRLPRYVMLLNDLHKYTVQRHPDKAVLARVCQELPQMVSRINKRIDADRAAAVQANVALASTIAGEGTDVIVRRERRLLREYALKRVVEEVRGAKRDKTHKKGVAYLFDTLLVVCTRTASGRLARTQPYTALSLIPMCSVLGNVVPTEKGVRVSARDDGRPAQLSSQQGYGGAPPIALTLVPKRQADVQDLCQRLTALVSAAQQQQQQQQSSV